MKAFISKLSLTVIVALSTAQALEQESEHPPLSPETKQAIAKYKQNPTDQNKELLKAALNKSYDKVIATKEQKLQEHTAQKQKHINQWLNLAKQGKIPPFLQKDGANNKDTSKARQALNAYQKSKDSKHFSALRAAFEEYYEAFLREQKAHIEETRRLKDERIKSSLERFSSKHFNPKPKATKQVANDEILLDVMRVFVCGGAEFVPINPEARVREREFNARIFAAQKEYENSPSAANKEKLKNEIKNALNAAKEARYSALKKAKQRFREHGADFKLFTKLADNEFLTQQREELMAQRNFYGRLDRLVSFEAETYNEGYTPSMAKHSKELYAQLGSQLSKTKYKEYYGEVLEAAFRRIDEVEKNLWQIADMLTNEMVGERE